LPGLRPPEQSPEYFYKAFLEAWGIVGFPKSKSFGRVDTRDRQVFGLAELAP
jgi:hypothetical protein